MPALTRVKKQARTVACRANLKQWNLFFSMFTQENNGYFEAGVGTVLSMHFPESDLREAREQKLAGNLIVTGHMASDSIGINFFLDELHRLGLTVVRGGGIVTPA